MVKLLVPFIAIENINIGNILAIDHVRIVDGFPLAKQFCRHRGLHDLVGSHHHIRKKKKGKNIKVGEKKMGLHVTKKKNGYLNLCYTRMITDELSVVYIKYNTYPQDFYTTSFYIGVIVMRWKMRPFQTGLQPHEKRHKTIIIR